MAGASIGTLYQYFPDKLSLIDAIRIRHLEDCITVIRSVRVDHQSPLEFSAQLVQAMIAAHSAYPGLHRVLLDEAPSTQEYRNPNSAFETEYLAYYAQAVATFRKREPVAIDHVTGRVISDAIVGVIHNAVRRGTIDDYAMQSELMRFVSLFLGEYQSGYADDCGAADCPSY